MCLPGLGPRLRGYIRDSMARRGGWRRLGSRGRFRYVDARGRRIADADALERIDSLPIPPAWRDVRISPRAKAKLQATGLDRAGRLQYLYHPEFRAQQEAAKFEKLIRFGEKLPDLRKAMAADIELDPFEFPWTAALAVRLINQGWFRVGDERCNLTGRGLNDYIQEHMGEEFTAKDFRTWGGTLIAAVGLAERGVAETEAESKRRIAAVMRSVGERLGNTPAVARASYVSPAVIEQYLDGRTIDDFRPRHLRVVDARDLGLDPEERAVLSLLRSWRIRRAREAA